MDASDKTLALPMQNYFFVFLLRHASVHGQSLLAALIHQHLILTLTLILTLEMLPVIPANWVATKTGNNSIPFVQLFASSFCSTKTDKSFRNINILLVLSFFIFWCYCYTTSFPYGVFWEDINYETLQA